MSLMSPAKAKLGVWVAVWLCGLAGFPDETAELQRRIDAACAAGGGRVVVAAGDHPITSIFLRSNVTLELARGARLYAASTNRDDNAGDSLLR